MRDRYWQDPTGRGESSAHTDEIRAANSDREATAELLRKHHADGRLTDDEFQERLEQSQGARTLGDLRALVADLPGEPAPFRAPPHWRRGRLPWLPLLLGLFLVSTLLGGHGGWGWHHGYGHHGPHGFHGHPGPWFPWPLLVFTGFALAALWRWARWGGWRGRWA